jgi:methylated-DNA-[protein]-cysteine S-methyltransferase
MATVETETDAASRTVALSALDTPVGPLLVAATALGIAGVAFGTGARRRARLAAGLRVIDEPAFTAAALDQLAGYFAGTRRDFDLDLDWWLVRSPLSRQTLEVLHTTVPYGATITYGELAGRVSLRRGGREVPARAIGSIMGSNPIPIVVPCHRVVAGDGLGGYSGGSGLEVKRRLLEHEGALPPTLDFES